MARGKTTSQRIKENQDAKSHVYSLVWEVSKEAYEEAQFIRSTFTKDGKFYIVGYTAHNPGQIHFTARSRGYKDFQILHTVGTKTPLKKGEFLTE